MDAYEVQRALSVLRSGYRVHLIPEHKAKTIFVIMPKAPIVVEMSETILPFCLLQWDKSYHIFWALDYQHDMLAHGQGLMLPFSCIKAFWRWVIVQVSWHPVHIGGNTLPDLQRPVFSSSVNTKCTCSGLPPLSWKNHSLQYIEAFATQQFLAIRW